MPHSFSKKKKKNQDFQNHVFISKLGAFSHASSILNQALTRISQYIQSHQMQRSKSGSSWVIQINWLEINSYFSCRKLKEEKSPELQFSKDKSPN